MVQKIIQYVLYLLLFSILCIIYEQYIVPVWGYSGFSLSINEIKIAESVVILLIIVTFLEKRPKVPSDFLLHIQFLFPFLPMLVLYGMADQDRGYVIACGLSFLVIKYMSRVRIKMNASGFISEQALLIFILVVSWLNIGSLMLLGLLEYLDFDIYQVYEFRRIAGELLSQYAVYLNAIVSAALLPLALVLSIKRKSFYFSILAFSGSIIMFGLTHYKSVLFYPFLVYGLYFLFSRDKLINYVLIVLISLTLFALVETSVEGLDDNIGSLVVRRVMYIPANNNFFYHQFFSENQKVYLSNSKITFGLLDYPYRLNASMLIGEAMNGKVNVRANTGWLGTGYMHFGYFGIFFFAAIVGFIFSIVDSIAKRKNKAIVQVITFAPFFALFLSSDLFTALLTHGLAFSLVLAWSLKVK